MRPPVASFDGVFIAHPPIPNSYNSNVPFLRLTLITTTRIGGGSQPRLQSSTLPVLYHPPPTSLMDFLASHGASRNANGGIYVNDVAYGIEKKLQVAEVYRRSLDLEEPLSKRAIATECGVSQGFVRKVVDKLHMNRRLLRTREVQERESESPIDQFASFLLFWLYLDEPSRTLDFYRESLFMFTGISVSNSSIERFFLNNFPYRGSFCKPNLVPYDKFRPENKARLFEYISFIVEHRPERIKFGDEKSLNGQELFCRKVRRNPLTGLVPPVITDPDFRNSHSITGFCGMDSRTNAVWYRIRRETNNSDSFSEDVMDAIVEGFLSEGDILVLDNAAIHTGGENNTLVDWMWSRHGIFVAFLLTRSPELNSIELLWNYLVQKLKHYPMQTLHNNMRSIGQLTDAAAFVAKEILDGLTHDLVWRFFIHCYKELM